MACVADLSKVEGTRTGGQEFLLEFDKLFGRGQAQVRRGLQTDLLEDSLVMSSYASCELIDVYKVYDLFVMIFFLERAGGAPAERLPPRIHLNRRPLNSQLIGENR